MITTAQICPATDKNTLIICPLDVNRFIKAKTGEGRESSKLLFGAWLYYPQTGATNHRLFLPELLTIV
jgi:hypothetical protein